MVALNSLKIQAYGFCLIDNCNGWYSPNLATSDLMNPFHTPSPCSVPNNYFGYQLPKIGLGYAAIITWNNPSISGFPEYKEYLSTKLIKRLIINRQYYFSCWVSLADTYIIACNNFGAYFSTDSIFGLYPQNLNYTSQLSNDIVNNQLTDKNNWTQFKGCITSNGDEEFLTLGNFLQSNVSDTIQVIGGNHNYASHYYIDDVSLYEVRGLNNNEDTAICSNAGFSKTLKVDTAYHNVHWNTGDTAHEIIVTTAGKYWVTSISPCCGTVTDTITINLRNPNAYKFNLGNDVLYCNSISKQLSIINPNLHNIVWNTNDTIPSINITQPGKYWATAQSECGLQTDTIIITKATIPNNIILQTDTTIYVGDTIIITAIDGLEQYEWSTGEFSQSIKYNSVITSPASGEVISLLAYTQDGCIATDSITIKTIAKPVVELPVIYPTIIHKSKEKLVFKNIPDGATVSIYNSLGQGLPNPSQGGALAEGVYYYVVSYEGVEVVRKLVVLE